MLWDTFGGWFQTDPYWLQTYKLKRNELSSESGLTEDQLDKVIQLFVDKDILRMS